MSGVPRIKRPIKSGGVEYRPIKLRFRQLYQLHDHDFDGRLLHQAVTRKRYSTWVGAWRALLKHVEEFPAFEWWLEEDLCKEWGGPRQWSQICPACDAWSIQRPERGDPNPPTCRYCGQEARERTRPQRTPPTSKGNPVHMRGYIAVGVRPDPDLSPAGSEAWQRDT